MMFCEHDVSVSKYQMQQFSVLKHPDVLALLFCISEHRALIGVFAAHSFDKLLSCRRITIRPPAGVIADNLAGNLADNQASDVATNMKSWRQQHTQTSPAHLCAGLPVGNLQNSSL